MNKHVGFRPYKPRTPGSTKAVVKELINQSGGIDAAALILDRSTTSVQAYSDHNAEQGISFDQVRRLTLSKNRPTAAAEDLALLAGGVFVPLGDPKECFHSLAAHSAREYGEFASVMLDALRDGKLCRLDRLKILPELDDLIRCLVHARAHLVNDSAGDS